jgi:hypothetical protein
MQLVAFRRQVAALGHPEHQERRVALGYEPGVPEIVAGERLARMIAALTDQSRVSREQRDRDPRQVVRARQGSGPQDLQAAVDAGQLRGGSPVTTLPSTRTTQ